MMGTESLVRNGMFHKDKELHLECFEKTTAFNGNMPVPYWPHQIQHYCRRPVAVHNSIYVPI